MKSEKEIVNNFQLTLLFKLMITDCREVEIWTSRQVEIYAELIYTHVHTGT